MRLPRSKKELKLIDNAFTIGVFLKAFDGALEMIGGLILLFLPLEKINSITAVVTRKELIEDPKDLIANYLVHTARSLTVSAVDFAIIFLLVHGLVKLFLAIMLLAKKLWAYPLAIVVFSVLGLYQIYQISLNGSVPLILLTLLDIIVIALTTLEYLILKRKAPEQ
jgi:uncharacterized membrane protein